MSFKSLKSYFLKITPVSTSAFDLFLMAYMESRRFVPLIFCVLLLVCENVLGLRCSMHGFSGRAGLWREQAYQIQGEKGAKTSTQRCAHVNMQRGHAVEAGGGLRAVSSSAPSLPMGVPRAEAAPVLAHPYLPWQRIAPTMAKQSQAPFQILVCRV